MTQVPLDELRLGAREFVRRAEASAIAGDLERAVDHLTDAGQLLRALHSAIMREPRLRKAHHGTVVPGFIDAQIALARRQNPHLRGGAPPVGLSSHQVAEWLEVTKNMGIALDALPVASTGPGPEKMSLALERPPGLDGPGADALQRSAAAPGSTDPLEAAFNSVTESGAPDSVSIPVIVLGFGAAVVAAGVIVTTALELLAPIFLLGLVCYALWSRTRPPEAR